MEEYPEELRTPPVALVAMVGVSELHPLISSYLHSQQPPINTLALPDFSNLSIIAAAKDRTPPSADARLPPPPPGILKIDWLRKHRTRVPAALILLLHRDQVHGDPAQWLQVCANLDNARNIIRGRNTKLVIVIVQPTLLTGDASEDRLVALRKRAEVDAKSFLTLINQDALEQKRSLARLGSILGELTNVFYREEGRRVKVRLEKKTFSSIELGIRYNFKVAAYAEFRRDWVEALKSYETAYMLLQETVPTPMELQLVQWLIEVKAVAEQLHFKISTLLLHSGKEVEAVKWLRQHISFYKHLIGPAETTFIHWGWMSRQYHVFAELLENSSAKVLPAPSSGTTALHEVPVTERELQPGYYYQVAASYMIDRRRIFEATSSMFEAFEDASANDVLAGPPEEVGPPLYVGQASRLLSRGDSLDSQRPTEKEYMHHAISQERAFLHSHAAIKLLMKSYERYKLINASRMVYYVGSEMGREYFHAKDYANAKRLFESVAGMYRQEAWVALLWCSLGYLRECTRQLQLLKEYVEYSLEMAALPASFDYPESQHSVFGREFGPAGPLCNSQRQLLFQEVDAILKGNKSVLPAQDGDHDLAVTESQPVSLEIDIVSPLRVVLSACTAFHEQTVKPGKPASLTLSLLTHLPQTLEIEKLEVYFNQTSCNIVLYNIRQEILYADAGGAEKMEDKEISKFIDLDLTPNKWKRFSLDVIAGLSGKLECLAVLAHVGKHSSIHCHVESPASREEISLWKHEPKIELLPMKGSILSFFGQRVIQVEEPEPLVDVVLECFNPGLVGEMLPVVVHVESKGHAVYSGEIRVSVTESLMAGATSPQEIHPTSADSFGVELFSASSSPPGVGKVDNENFQKLSGLITLPSLEINGRWSTRLFVRWQKPKSVNLFVSLSYHSANISEETYKLHRYFVHKVLQLNCEEAFTIKYHFLAPFRRDTLLLTGLGSKQVGQPTRTISIPLNEKSTLMVNVKNSSSLDVKLLSITVDAQDDTCSVRSTGSSYGSEACRDTSVRNGMLPGIVLRPGEVFTHLFSVQPTCTYPALEIGILCLKWERLTNSEAFENMHSGDFCASNTLEMQQSLIRTNIPLPSVQVEKPPIILTFDCPPYALLGMPFTLFLKVQNQTSLIQVIKFSIVDSPSFLLAGVHSDTIHVLPFSRDVLSFKVVPLTCGLQQLPLINLTAVRYNKGFQYSTSSNQLFIFPSAPQRKGQTRQA